MRTTSATVVALKPFSSIALAIARSRRARGSVASRNSVARVTDTSMSMPWYADVPDASSWTEDTLPHPDPRAPDAPAVVSGAPAQAFRRHLHRARLRDRRDRDRLRPGADQAGLHGRS